MKTITLNIGLNTNDGETVPLHFAFLTLCSRFEIYHSRVDTSGEEDCIVAIVENEGNRTSDLLHEICQLLKQDCIAVFDGENGELIGPNAAKWGQFREEFFVPFDAPKETEVNGFLRENFIHYLRETIIPDSKEAGFEGYASDLETALFFLTH